MVLKTELCRFSGKKIYPGWGSRFVRGDSQTIIFGDSKTKQLFHNRKRPAKLAWTIVYRKQHKKIKADVTQKKKRKSTKNVISRGIGGATLELIQKKRTESNNQRQAARDAALREVKERAKKLKEQKKATAKSKSGGKSSAPPPKRR